VLPRYYPIPDDGPVGALLRRTGRHPYRPAHIHFIAGAAGFSPVTTHLFVDGSPYLDDDTVFGVKHSLIRRVHHVDDPVLAAEHDLGNPFDLLEFDISLARAG
jgi:catechol 1,2-dioxygenase